MATIKLAANYIDITKIDWRRMRRGGGCGSALVSCGGEPWWAGGDGANYITGSNLGDVLNANPIILGFKS